MKYCLSNSQPISILKKADEIFIETKDYQSLPIYFEKYPNKNIILNLEFSIDKIFNYLKERYLGQENLIIACPDFNTMKKVKEVGFKFYLNIPTRNFYELQGLKELGVCYIKIGAPLTFDLTRVKNYGIPIRMIPNIAYEPYFYHENGIHGQYIRPEDVKKYAEYIDVLEFYTDKVGEEHRLKEGSLFNIYAKEKCWNGNLNIIIDNLNYNVDNRLIYDKEIFAERRMNCQQKCVSNPGSCHFCEDRLRFGELLKNYTKNTEDN